MFRTQNLCLGSKNVFDSKAKTFFVFRAAKCVSATLFPSLARPKHCTKRRAARAARLYLFIQPIKLLICGVVVDVAVLAYLLV